MSQFRTDLSSDERIERHILFIRGHKVMVSVHLAGLNGVETRALNQAVRRNIERFSEDFVFHLTPVESEWPVSQNVVPLRILIQKDVCYTSSSRTEVSILILPT